MIENPECYQVGEYQVPESLVNALLTANWTEEPDILRPGLSSTSRVIYFPCSLTDRYDQVIPDKLHPIRDAASAIADDVVRKNFPNCTIVKGEISLLKKLGKQSGHQDPRTFHRLARRIHLPVITNINSKLCIDNRQYHMPKNTLWAFDNVTGMHWSQNFGISDRWHIIVDIVDTTMLKFILEKITVDEFYSLWWHWLDTAPLKLIQELGLEQAASIPVTRTTQQY